MNLLVAGTRYFDDPALLFKKLDHLTKKLNKKKLVIVTGGGIPVRYKNEPGKRRGADSLAMDWAFKRRVTCKNYYPNWKKYGDSAGPRRNSEMVEVADFACVFWDGKSRGTADVIKKCRKKSIRVVIVKVRI